MSARKRRDQCKECKNVWFVDGQYRGCCIPRRRRFVGHAKKRCELFCYTSKPPKVMDKDELTCVPGQLVMVGGSLACVAEVLSDSTEDHKCEISAHPVLDNGQVLTRSYIRPIPLDRWEHVDDDSVRRLIDGI